VVTGHSVSFTANVATFNRLAMLSRAIIVVVTLLAPSAILGLKVTPRNTSTATVGVSAMNLLRPNHMELGSVNLVSFRQDCGYERHVGMLGVGARRLGAPGAGLDTSVKPYAKVLKDGYYFAECAQDYMYEYGDKFGGNKLSYELSSISNVSIVHYEKMVPKEDREEMTHTVCFGLCRTIPDMLFFGIKNGNKCYCAPYFKPMAGDDTVCDTPCEGDSTTLCGSNSKSSMFQMHMCSNTKEDLAQSKEKLDEAGEGIKKIFDKVKKTGQFMQAAAADLQPVFGKLGDGAASDLLQAGKVRAGEIKKQVLQAKDVSDEIKKLDEKYAKTSKGDFEEFEAATEAEALIDDMDKASTNGQAQIEELTSLLDASGPEELPKGATKEYFPAMYFVEKEFAEVPSTCGGKMVGQPLVGTMDDCAAACDSKMGGCVGFSYFPRKKSGLCFLLDKFKSVTYYSGCKKEKEEEKMLLQTQQNLDRREAGDTKCMAKFSMFDGTTLKPDPSGKCKHCMRKASEVKKCFD